MPWQPGCVAAKRQQFLILTASRSPDDCSELKNLRRDTSRVADGIFRLADDFAFVIDASGETVIASESRQRTHHAVFPDETETGIADIIRSGEKRRAAPALAYRVRLSGLSDTYDRSAIIDS